MDPSNGDQKPYALFALGIILIIGVIVMAIYTFTGRTTAPAPTPTAPTTPAVENELTIVAPPVEEPFTVPN